MEKIKIIYTFWEASRNRTIYVASFKDEKREVHIGVRPNESLEEVLKTNNLI